MTPLDGAVWPANRIGEMIRVLARRGGLDPREVDLPMMSHPVFSEDRVRLGEWIESAADMLAIEAEPMETRYPEIEDLLRGAGPAILCLPGQGPPRLFALLGSSGNTLRLLGTDLEEIRVPVFVLRDALCCDLEREPAKAIDRLLESARVRPLHRASARASMLRERLSAARLGGCWALRLAPGASIGTELRVLRFGRRALGIFLALFAEYALGLLAWWMLGRGALQGRFDPGYLFAWSLVLWTQIPFRYIGASMQGRLSIDIGARLKQRLLAGALALAPEQVRSEGAGAMLGRVIESEVVESLALGAGYTSLAAILELVVAGVLLSLGAGGFWSLALLGTWIGLVVCLGWRYFRRRRAWTQVRVEMTHDLVERIVGHRTRLAQQTRERWHEGEDEAAARYVGLSRQMDDTGVLVSLVPRGFLAAGVATLIPAFLSGAASSGSLAVGLGATILAYRALGKWTQGLTSLVGAVIAWEKVKPLFDAAARTDVAAAPMLALSPSTNTKGVLVEAHDLTFRYRDRGRMILRGCSLCIRMGDRLLLEGGSGGGKSTLGSILAGLRLPQEGLLLMGGLDRPTLGGPGFRRFVVAAPQFHENHVLSGTFSFNLFMGRRWPPRAADMTEAKQICEELDLGPLLSRMPGGFEQMVGDHGWQLSHGERSRLFIARALLQRAPLVVLDESFAALDPKTLERALRCVLARASTVLVIAHP